MPAPVTRREFLGGLRPSWCTKRNLMWMGAGALMMVAAYTAANIIRSLGFTGLLRLGAIAVCLLVAYKLLTKLSSIYGRVPRIVRKVIASVLFGTVFAAFLTSLAREVRASVNHWGDWNYYMDMAPGLCAVLATFLVRRGVERAERMSRQEGENERIPC